VFISKLCCVYFHGSKTPEMCPIQTYSGSLGRENPQEIGVGICLKEKKGNYIL